MNTNTTARVAPATCSYCGCTARPGQPLPAAHKTSTRQCAPLPCCAGYQVATPTGAVRRHHHTTCTGR